MRTHFRIILNTLTTWAAITVNITISIILVPFLLNKLGIEAYGLIALATVLISVSIFTDLGFQTSLSRNLAEQIATGNTQQFNQVLNTGLILYMSLGLLLAGICIVFSSFLADLLKVSADTKSEAIGLIRYYVGPAILILFTKPVFISILSSHNRFDIISAINTGVSVFRGIGILIVLSFPDTGLYQWASVSLIAQSISLAFVFISARTILPSLDFRIRHVKKAILKELLSTGKYISLLQCSWVFRLRINTIILSLFLGPTAAALYRPAESISTIIKPVINSLAAQLFPLTTGYHVTDNMNKLRSVLLRGTRYILLLAIPLCVMFIVFPKPIMKVWLEKSIGSEYVITASVLFYMTLIDLFLYAGGTQTSVLLGMNKIKFISTVSILFALFGFACSILLLAFTSIGIIGVIIPAVCASAIIRGIIVIHAARMCRIPVKRYLSISYARPMTIFLIIVMAAITLRIFFNPQSVYALFLCALSIGTAWILLCWTIGFDHNDKKECMDLLKTIWQKTIKNMGRNRNFS